MIAPPLLVSYSSLDSYLGAMSLELRTIHESQIRKLTDQKLPPVASSRCLALLFGYSPKFVNMMSQNNWKYYRTFVIKQGRKKRTIQAPRVSLKVIQKWFGHHLSEAVSFDPAVFGFISGKSAPMAAMQHVNAKWVYSVDIRDFFSSTPEDQIISALTSQGYSDSAAKLLAGLMCYKNFLAQGSPASPVLSNLVFQQMDVELKAVAEKCDVRFTRYADDIVFSGIGSFPESIKDEVKGLFHDSCWQLSKEKEYFSELPKRLKVHGLLVHQELPRLAKGYRNKIRAYRHLVENNKVEKDDMKRILGHINYANSIDRLKQGTQRVQKSAAEQPNRSKGAKASKKLRHSAK